MRIILHELSLLIVAQCVTVRSIHYQRCNLGARRKNTTLSAKTEQFITAEISGNALKQESETQSVLRQRSSRQRRKTDLDRKSQVDTN